MSVRRPFKHAADELLADRIVRRDATVAVVGLGYVGLPLLAAVCRAGFNAIGLDHDHDKITSLNDGKCYLPHLGSEVLRDLAAAPSLVLSSEASSISAADIALLCVPTPLNPDRTPDLSAVERAAGDVATFMTRGTLDDGAKLVVLESTTYPGTTREVLLPRVTGGDSGRMRVHAAFSPEREDPGNAAHSTRTIPKLIGGTDDISGDLAELLYSALVDSVVRVESSEIAEAAKLVENIYRSVNIALVNELKMVLCAMGLDVWDVLDAAETKPFGFHRFNPGPGFGGHCVPIDPYYFSWSAQRAGQESRFIELAGEINRLMPGYVIDRCRAALASTNRTLAGASVLILGIAYKPNVGDVRESPSFELIELLRTGGATVAYHDPFVSQTWRGRRHDLKMRSIEWSPKRLSEYDLVVIATDHDWYDYSEIGQHARLIVDTRNAMSRASGPIQATVIKA